MPEERSIKQLVADALGELRAILRGEISLAKAEAKQSAIRGGIGAAAFAGAAALGAVAGLFALVALTLGLVALGVPDWLAFLLVAFLLVVIAAGAAIVGISEVKKVRGLRSTTATLASLKTSITDARSRAAQQPTAAGSTRYTH